MKFYYRLEKSNTALKSIQQQKILKSDTSNIVFPLLQVKTFVQIILKRHTMA